MAPKKNRTATKKTSTSRASGERVNTSDLRQETDGVKTAIQADIASPESPILPDEKLAEVGPAEPQKIGKLEQGDTVASHEAHVVTSSPAALVERIEKESGPDGLPTDVIAREQQARAARLEFQRVEGTGRVAGVRDSERPKRGGDAA
jgi:hypothetical protein